MPIAGSFEICSQVESYKNVNRIDSIRHWIALIAKERREPIKSIADVATGAGMMTELFLEELPPSWPVPQVTCIDMSEEALSVTRENFREHGLPLDKITFVCSPVEHMSLAPESIDVAVWGNGIHYVSAPDQSRALFAIHRALTPGGWFFFNTTFYEGAMPAETGAFYKAQVSGAVKIMRDQRIPRNKQIPRPEASDYKSVAHYENLLSSCGFRLMDKREAVVRSDHEFWQALCGYHQYAAGALHGYPAVEAAAALQVSVREALEAHGQSDQQGKFIPRPWLIVAAQKV